jgi:hypothetical protein
MSNALAVAAVTATLRHLLEQSLGGDQPGPVGGAVVTTLPPEDLARRGQVDGIRGINVFLYQVTPNHAWNLTDLPTRDSEGRLTRTPVAALDLHYLISFHGADATLEPQRLLARAILALTVTPMLTKAKLASMVERFSADTDLGFLTATDLRWQPELVKLAPTTLTLEEMSRLWSVLGTPYMLSVTYAATVALIQPRLTPRPVLPVRHPVVAVGSAAPPRLGRLAPDVAGPVEAGTRLVLDGARLLGGGNGVTTHVRVGPARLQPEPGSTDGRVTVLLGEDVSTGVHAVQVVQQSTAGPGGARVLGRSDTLPVVVRPRITVAVDDETVRLTLAPPVHPGQDAVVTLERLDEGAPHLLEFPVPASTAMQDSVALRRADVPDGRWRVQIRVDGVSSLPTRSGDTYLGPEVVLP